MMTLKQKQILFDRVAMDHGLMATAGSDLDKELQEFEELGAVKLYDSMFGNHYYSLTKEGRDAIRPKEED